jgi:isocitrate dehydrogenase (NAD+)
MLRHIGRTDAAERVEAAVRDVIAEGRTVTYDLGGSAGTREFADAIVERLQASAASTTASARAPVRAS